MGVELVWFKRDLRIADHEPVVAAAKSGPVLGLYVFEPEVLGMPETDARHVGFVLESLVELREALRARGSELLIRRGEITEVLGRLREELPIARLWSHEETGLATTFDRDRRVARWCSEVGLRWVERAQFGIVRGLRDRDGWSARWNERMKLPPIEPPSRFAPLPDGVVMPETGEIPTLEELDFEAPTHPQQPGGESEAGSLLEGFLTERGVNYRMEMASPVTAPDACSRLSPHIAYGTIGMRTVNQAVTLARREYSARRRAGDPSLDRRWIASLRSYEKRLRWHCHFMQKLESEPEIEFRCMNRAYEGLRVRESDWGPEERARFDAWRHGRTGYPLVDAVMRSLDATGWINFRMRAMVVSFAAYHLWLDWRPVARELGRRFIDYEPGIHISQCQMQSGVTGINQIRIYSPARQVLDNDPAGTFIREWVPELGQVSAAWLPHPEAMPPEIQKGAACRIGRDYPEPIVDHQRAVAEARERIGEVRASDEARKLAREVLERHGSRRRRRPRFDAPRSTRAKAPPSDQLGLDL